MDKAIAEQLEFIERTLGKRKGALNTAELAAILGVSSSTIDGWRKSGCGVEYIKPAGQGNGEKGRVLYPTLCVAKWLVKHTIKTA
jgi:phage terminase Nu1 subunit (DNA packaging protein)